MKELSLPVMALATLCLVGCEHGDRTDRTNRTNVGDAVKPGPAPAGDQARGPSDSPRHTDQSPPPAPEGTKAAPGSEARSEFVAASRRRLDELDRELGQLEARSRERGRELRSEIREEKLRLDRELDDIDEQTDQAWSQMKGGFADALERLEAQIRQVRKDIDPAA